MDSFPIPPNEEKRLEALRSYEILDTPEEQFFDDITFMASMICKTPVSAITFVDEKRQWFKSYLGMPVRETERKFSICTHAIMQSGVFTVKDAKEDARFADFPSVHAEPYIRFYAGTPLVTEDGQALGTLCVIDHEPRQLSPEQTRALESLSRQTVALLELRKTSATLVKLNQMLLQEIELRKELASNPQ